jgi:hypothetical protein
VRNMALEVAQSSITPGHRDTRRCQSGRTRTGGCWPPPVRCSTFCTECLGREGPRMALETEPGQSRGMASVDQTEARNTPVSERGICRLAPRRHAGLLCLAHALYEPHRWRCEDCLEPILTARDCGLSRCRGQAGIPARSPAGESAPACSETARGCTLGRELPQPRSASSESSRSVVAPASVPVATRADDAGLHTA